MTASVIPFVPAAQPVPVETLVSQLDHVTAITRIWGAGDTDRCRLCPACAALRNVCTILTTEAVHGQAAKLYRLPVEYH